MAKFSHLNIPTEWEQYWSKYPEGYTMLEALIDWTGQVDEMVDYINAGTDTEGNTIDLSQYLKKEDFELYLITSNTINQLQNDITNLQDNSGGSSGDGGSGDGGLGYDDVLQIINEAAQNQGFFTFEAVIDSFNTRISGLESRIEGLENI